MVHKAKNIFCLSLETKFIYSCSEFFHFTISLKGTATAAAKSPQSRWTLCDPIDGSPPGSTVPGILQERTLERAAISFSNAWKWKVKVKSLSRVWLSTTPWTTAYQAPLPMGLSRQEYWTGLPYSSPFKRKFNFKRFLEFFSLKFTKDFLYFSISQIKTKLPTK